MKELPLAVMFKDDKKRLLISYDNQSKKFFLVDLTDRISSNTILIMYYLGLAIYSYISNISFVKKFINMPLNVSTWLSIFVAIAFALYRSWNFYKSFNIRLSNAEEYEIENIQQTIYGIENANQGFWFSIAKSVLVFALVLFMIYLPSQKTFISNYCFVVASSDMLYTLIISDIYRRFKLKGRLQVKLDKKQNLRA